MHIMSTVDGLKLTRVIDEIDYFIKDCYCHRFAKLRGVDGVLLVRPKGAVKADDDILYNIIVLSENMSSSERQITFLEDMVNEYIKSKIRYDKIDLTWNINVIYTSVSNIKSVLHTGDEKVSAYVYFKTYYSQAAKEIVMGSASVAVCEDNVHVALFEKLY